MRSGHHDRSSWLPNPYGPLPLGRTLDGGLRPSGERSLNVPAVHECQTGRGLQGGSQRSSCVDEGYVGSPPTALLQHALGFLKPGCAVIEEIAKVGRASYAQGVPAEVGGVLPCGGGDLSYNPKGVESGQGRLGAALRRVPE